MIVTSKPFLELDAIEIQQPLSNFYAVSMRASLLCELVFSVPAKYSDQALTGTQRQIKDERTDKISIFVNGVRATFPNSIILGANFNPDGDLVDDEVERWTISRTKNGLKLIIPRNKPLASIIDGQHRLDGFRKSFENEANPQDMDLLCSVYFDLPSPEQAEIFATINYNQQKVDKSLAYQLFGYNIDSSNNTLLWPPETLAVYFSRLLNTNLTSPFQGLIRSGLMEDSKNNKISDGKILKINKPELSISTAAIVEGVVKLFSTDPVGDRYQINKKTFIGKGREVLKNINSNAPLRPLYITGNDRAIYDLTENFFNSVKKVFWDEAKSGSKVLSTIGVLAMFDVLNHLLKFLPASKEGCSVDNFVKILQPAGVIDFSDDYFNFAGVGRSQIRNIVLLMLDTDNEFHKNRVLKLSAGNDFEKLKLMILKYRPSQE